MGGGVLFKWMKPKESWWEKGQRKEDGDGDGEGGGGDGKE